MKLSIILIIFAANRFATHPVQSHSLPPAHLTQPGQKARRDRTGFCFE
ncbi:MAG TPA: hypothetical protein VF177_05525 [Anaerolineae bacterium]